MRQYECINKDWQFIKGSSDAMVCPAQAQSVTLPHTWNAQDGQDGGNDYYRGEAWYYKTLDLPQTADGAEKPAQATPKKAFLTGGVQEILDLARLAADTLGNLRRKLRMEELMLRVRFGGGDDAAKTAILYGRAWAVIGALLPCLERIFVIKKRDIGAELDYNVDEKMAVDAHMVLTITIGRALALALRAGIGFLKIYQAYQDKNKGGAVHESSSE